MSDNPITVLTEDECWDFLVQNELGRLAFVTAGEPEIVPINYLVVDRKLLFRTAEGTKLLGVTMCPSVAFEVDSYGAVQAKSVIAYGTARLVESREEIEKCEQLPLRPWVPTIKHQYVEIQIERLSGRLFTLGEEPERAMM